MIDSVSGGGAGALIGGATISGGQAVVGATSQYVSLPSGLLGSTSAVTIEGWFYVSPTTNTSNIPRLFAVGSLGTQDVGVQFSKSGLLTACQYVSGTWSTLVGTSLSITSLGYFHVALVLTNLGYPQLYVNGMQTGSPSTTVTLPTPSQQSSFYLFKSVAGSQRGIAGSVDEFRIWSSALSPGEISANYKAGDSALNNSFDIVYCSFVEI